MTPYRLTERATKDLIEIWNYIADDSPDAADRVEDAIQAACVFLVENPQAGQLREDLTPLAVRFWLLQPFRTYWIVYDPETKPLQILRILHGARDISSTLK